MNKVKMFFVAAALLLTTAAVFAGKAKFATPSNLWAYDPASGLAFELATGDLTGNLTTTPQTNPATIKGSQSGTDYLLYQITGTPAVYTQVYTLNF